MTGKRQPLNEDLIVMKNIANKTMNPKSKRLFKKEDPAVRQEKSGETIYECEVCSMRMVVREAKEVSVN